ncbi:hypothetical protein NW753_012357 [Fusarium oxysporum]|nr:hypothetical protein NW753_012357 [Fusarium oxysporum]
MHPETLYTTWGCVLHGQRSVKELFLGAVQLFKEVVDKLDSHDRLGIRHTMITSVIFIVGIGM